MFTLDPCEYLLYAKVVLGTFFVSRLLALPITGVLNTDFVFCSVTVGIRTEGQL